MLKKCALEETGPGVASKDLSPGRGDDLKIAAVSDHAAGVPPAASLQLPSAEDLDAYWRQRENASGQTVSHEQRLAEDEQRLIELAQQATECLDPREIEMAIFLDYRDQFSFDARGRLEASLQPERQAHLAQCKYCQNLVAVATPSQTQMERRVSQMQEILAAGQSAAADPSTLSRLRAIAEQALVPLALVAIGQGLLWRFL